MDNNKIKLNDNILKTISYFTDNKLNITELEEVYDFLYKLVSDRKPESILFVPKEEQIRVLIKLMSSIPMIEKLLTDTEKEQFAFCVYLSNCITSYDKKNK